MKFRRLKSRRASREVELERELQTHLELEAEEQRESGIAPEEAVYAARRALGNTAQIKEDVRAAWGFQWLETLLQDLRYGLRQLRRNPGFTAIAVITLALGIGANTAMFSVLNAVLLQPLPYQSPSQLVMLWSGYPSRGVREERTAYWNIEQWRRQSETFAGIAIVDPASATLTDNDTAERIGIARVSPNFFALLGIRPLEGRVFSAKEAEHRKALALISYGFWQSHFGGSPDALGATVDVDSLPRQIIGILPEGFQFPKLSDAVWEPDTLSPNWELARAARGTGSWFAVGRLRPGVTIKQAQAEMNTVARRLDSQLPASERELGIRVAPLSAQVTGPRLRFAIWMLMGAVLCVLLIAAINVAGLLLARGAGREKEIAIRSALGATHIRIVRQLLTESLTLACISGSLGLFVAWAGVRVMVLLKPPEMARRYAISVDPRVLGFAVGICLLTGVLVGLAPALALGRKDSSRSVQGGGWAISGSAAVRGIRRGLVTTEFTLAIILLIGAGLLIRSLWSIENVDPGFRPQHVLSAQLCTPSLMGNAQRVSFYNRTLETIESLPGVKSAGIIENFFITGEREGDIAVEGSIKAAWEHVQFRSDEVSADFFRTLGAPLLRGRFFSEEDGPGSPRVAIINEAMARRLWPGRDPVGRRLKPDSNDPNSVWLTVVGVVGNMRRQGLQNEPTPQVFVPMSQDPSRLATLLVRTSGSDPIKIVGALRAAVRQVDKQVPVYGVATLPHQLGAFLGQRRIQSSLLIVFAVMALLMAAVGIFGLIQYSVATRTHEIGIRMALGARRLDIIRLMVGEGFTLTVIGMTIGVIAALALTRFMSSLLYGIKPTDPLTFAAVSSILITVALLASYIPARRAAKVDPMVALRHE